MPLVVVTRDPEAVGDDMARILGPLLQTFIAEALDVPGNKDARLKASDVEVRFQNIGPLDVNSSKLAIEVLANDYPERRENLQDRTRDIANRLYYSPKFDPSFFYHDNAFIWVLLAPAGFIKL